MILANMSTSASSCAPPASSAAERALESLFQKAFEGASARERDILKQMHALGKSPKKSHKPRQQRTDAEHLEHKLYERKKKFMTEFSQAAVLYLQALQERSNVTERAAKA